MLPREDDVYATEGEGLNRGYGIGGPQRGTPYATRVVLRCTVVYVDTLT